MGIKGTNFAVVTACATGTNALGEACETIRRGQADVMLSGSGKVSASFYYGDGSNLSGLPSGVGGANAQVQFNDEGVFSGSSDFTFATGSSTLSVNTGSVEVLSASNYVSASTYYGDASNLTSVTASFVTASNISGLISNTFGKLSKKTISFYEF